MVTYLSIYIKNHFKTDIVRSTNKHLEGLDPIQQNYYKEIINIIYALKYLSDPKVYKTLYAAYTLTEYYALDDISSTP